MFYIPPPKIFVPQEIFPPHVIAKHTDKNGDIDNVIWRLMDPRCLWSAVQLRDQFGPMTVNNYLWKGENKNRGYRDAISLIDQEYFKQTGIIRASWSSFTSQHCFGRALDSSFKNILVKEVRSYIIVNRKREYFKYITAIEKEVPWLHFDTRNFRLGNERIFIF